MTDRYHVTTCIDDRTIAFQHPLADPFVRHSVYLGWRDLLRGLLRRGLTVTVVIGGDRATVASVMALLEPEPAHAPAATHTDTDDETDLLGNAW
ncbi:hypothetical protein [Streptomyces sp. SID3343]|uniref:hypothetical protein n=1 Tax=Streptomyces sp. SID3343 TaxID=2690260 RepID=UPI0013703033|nr:hypothetical protein [Streptomyces sp. SID3343]MYW03481.1 hypothetical protein [Streptomyces sp. SID3343]